MNSLVKKELEKYTKPTDVISEVEPTTVNHYNLNFRFEVLRDNKKYFISIKEVEVMGEIKKHHLRLEVDTDLEKAKPAVDTEKINGDIEVLKNWLSSHKRLKGSRIWISQERKMNILQRKIN